MLRTNTKQVAAAIAAHVMEYYPTVEALRADANAAAMMPRDVTADAKGRRLVEGGCFLCYIYQVRDFLREALQETDAEAQRYNDRDVWELYTHLVAKSIARLIG